MNELNHYSAENLKTTYVQTQMHTYHKPTTLSLASLSDIISIYRIQ